MSNFQEDLESELGEEVPVGVVIGNFNRWYENEPDKKNVPAKVRNRLLDWKEARPYLNYEYDSGYGGTECHPVYVWTETRIIFISCYDGYTSVCSLPRHPSDCRPGMFGGG